MRDAVVWGQYIDYLTEWAKTHSDLEFCGMSPVCFEEWLDNEYYDSELESDFNDGSNIGCKDCPDDECTGHCMSCCYRPI